MPHLTKAVDTSAMRAFGAEFARVAAEVPEREALVFDDLRWTYRDFYKICLDRAASLTKLGLKRGTHVGIMLGNCPEFIELYTACAMAGLVAVCVPTRYRARELEYVIGNSEVEVLFCIGDASRFNLIPLLREAFPALDGAAEMPVLEAAPGLKHVFVTGARDGALRPYDEFIGLADEPARAGIEAGYATLDPNATLLMLYTSGTTSFPKGCPVRDIATVVMGYNMHERFRIKDGARLWDALPVYHISWTAMYASAILARGTMVAASDTSPALALQMLERERCDTGFPVFATVWVPVLTHPDFTPEKLRHLRTILIVDPTEDIRASEDNLPNLHVVSSFGMSEAAAFITLNHGDDTRHNRQHTVGRPMPGLEVRLWDEVHGVEVADGEIGEIQTRGVTIFEGYYKDPVKNAEVFLDGWFRTGDLGTWDGDGRVMYRGRLKDMLKVGGENVAAVEIEGLLCMHPEVAIAQVIGVPDARMSEVPGAFVELHPGASVTRAELAEWCRGQIASFKLPRYLQFVPAGGWPMSATKIQKNELKKMEIGERLIG